MFRDIGLTPEDRAFEKRMGVDGNNQSLTLLESLLLRGQAGFESSWEVFLRKREAMRYSTEVEDTDLESK